MEEVIAQEVAASEFEDGFSTRGAIGCSHQRAPDLYYESINDEGCNITSFECDSYVNVSSLSYSYSYRMHYVKHQLFFHV